LELLAQRKQVAANLTAIRDKASALLKQLSSEHPFPWARNRRPTVKKARRKTKTVKKSARKTKRASRDETGKG
jgi:hypothetical protein